MRCDKYKCKLSLHFLLVSRRACIKRQIGVLIVCAFILVANGLTVMNLGKRFISSYFVITAAILYMHLWFTMPACAVIISSGDTNYNNSAPSGALTNSGWQLEGQWNGFLGTPIAPRFFLAAKHIGGSVGQIFIFNEYDYNTVGYTDSAGSDLRVWGVAETFPYYAHLYSGTNELGQHCVVFGRGTQGGEPVISDGRTNGWLWGAVDGVQRWGENQVATIQTNLSLGEFLSCNFDRDAPNTNECHLSVGDSSGGLFIKDGSVWKLAGINYGVSGPFSQYMTGSNSFQAALLDMRGLYVEADSTWTEVPTNIPSEVPSAFYSTRISAHIDWISSVIDYQTGSDLRIVSISGTVTDNQISISTASNRLYSLEYCDDLVAGSWGYLTNGLPGTNGIMTVTDPGGASYAQRFYRLKLKR